MSSLSKRKAGVLEQDFTVVQLPSETDLFTDMNDSADNSDAEDELLHVMNAVQGSDSARTLQEIMTAENEASIRSECADNTWNETSMSEFQPNSSEACASSDENECEQVTLEPPAKRVKTYKEAVECLEDV